MINTCSFIWVQTFGVISVCLFCLETFVLRDVSLSSKLFLYSVNSYRLFKCRFCRYWIAVIAGVQNLGRVGQKSLAHTYLSMWPYFVTLTHTHTRLGSPAVCITTFYVVLLLFFILLFCFFYLCRIAEVFHHICFNLFFFTLCIEEKNQSGLSAFALQRKCFSFLFLPLFILFCPSCQY